MKTAEMGEEEEKQKMISKTRERELIAPIS